MGSCKNKSKVKESDTLCENKKTYKITYIDNF